MKKLATIIILGITVLSLGGCFGGDDTTTDTPTQNDQLAALGKVAYTTKNFTIIVPDKWEVIENSSFISNVPKDTVVAFRNDVKNEVFTANVNVSQTTLEEEISSSDFGKGSLKITKDTIVNFKETSGQSFDYNNNGTNIPAYVAEFEGKSTASGPIVHFKQVFIIKDKTAYTVTSAYTPTESETVVKTMDEMLNSLTLN